MYEYILLKVRNAKQDAVFISLVNVKDAASDR